MCCSLPNTGEKIRQELTFREAIPLTADAVWAVIGDFSGIRKWAGLVEAESTEVTPRARCVP